MRLLIGERCTSCSVETRCDIVLWFGFVLRSTPYTPLDKRAMENTDEDTATDDWSLEQPLAQTRTTAIVEVKGAVNVVLTPLVAESLDR